MKISTEELNELLHKEYERGRQAGLKEQHVQTITSPIKEHNYTNYIPESCRTCPNHPGNGGSGNCNCILGLAPITYTTTTTTTFEL